MLHSLIPLARVDGKTQKKITQKVLFGLTGITQKGKTEKGKRHKVC
jgi:hypothetical protein